MIFRIAPLAADIEGQVAQQALPVVAIHRADDRPFAGVVGEVRPGRSRDEVALNERQIEPIVRLVGQQARAGQRGQIGIQDRIVIEGSARGCRCPNRCWR